MATFDTAQRKALAKTGAAEPDGSFPIRNAKDLQNAIDDFGRAGSKPADKAHIIDRAKALGLASKLPESWGVADGNNDADDKTSGNELSFARRYQRPRS